MPPMPSHGTSAYAIGLKVEDAAGNDRSAPRRWAPSRSSSRSDAGELQHPGHPRRRRRAASISSTRASELGRVWEHRVRAGRRHDARRRRPRRASTTSPRHELRRDADLAAVLHDRSSRRGRRRWSISSIPAGLVRSQVIENADGSLRLTLNGAENRRTLAGHFIAESFGSERAASRLCHRRHLRHGRGAAAAASGRCRSRRTTTTISRPASAWIRGDF